jgi:hypothetical protein
MTPKEKAEELVLRFLKLQEPNYNWFNKQLAKQCALISVEEILKSNYKVLSGVKPSFYDYWQQVKIEIEKL